MPVSSEALSGDNGHLVIFEEVGGKIRGGLDRDTSRGFLSKQAADIGKDVEGPKWFGARDPLNIVEALDDKIASRGKFLNPPDKEIRGRSVGLHTGLLSDG